jgi:hypothetical protein
MANPVAQKLKKFSELVRILLEFLPPPEILNSFSATLGAKFDQNFVFVSIPAKYEYMLREFQCRFF